MANRKRGPGRPKVYGDQMTIATTTANRRLMKKWAKLDKVPVPELFRKMVEAEQARRG